MGVVLGGRYLRREREHLADRLYRFPPAPSTARPLGADGIGDISIRALLTYMSHWRGAGAALYSEGVWPRLVDSPGRPIFELGPVLSARNPLLTDAQCIRLLCEGDRFERPSLEAAEAYLAHIRLDVHDSAARYRAIQCAAIFYEWRDGAYDWRSAQQPPIPEVRQPGVHCRLPHTLASMARLVAGLGMVMIPLRPAYCAGCEDTGAAPPRVFAYPDDAFPDGGFGRGPSPGPAAGGFAPPPTAGGPGPASGPSPGPATAGAADLDEDTPLANRRGRRASGARRP
jgi:hypothetical protein